VLRKLGPVRPVGTRAGLTKTMAEKQLRKLMADVAAPVIERVTVEDAAERLLEHLEAMGRKPSTLRAYRCLLSAQIGPRIGDRPVARVSTEDVERLIAALRRDGLSVKTTTNMLGFLHSIMEHSVRRGWATTNPCRRVERPRSDAADSKEIHFLDGPEIEALLQAVPDDDYGRVYRAVYLCAVMTGLRRGELDGNALLRSFQRALASAAVRRVRFHDLRHTFGTRMAAAGVPMRTLQEWLGHRDFATTLIYADYAPGAHEVDLVNGAFNGAGYQFGYQSEHNSDQLDPTAARRYKSRLSGFQAAASAGGDWGCVSFGVVVIGGACARNSWRISSRRSAVSMSA
jgi:site-specific recombinase XerD